MSDSAAAAVDPRRDDLIVPARLRKPRLRRTEAAEYLALVHGIAIAPATLAKWAGIGRGPPFGRLYGTPMYPRDGIDQWVAATLAPVDLGDVKGKRAQISHQQRC